jgi:predicted DNA-binding transcriptional regulator YafY
VTEKKSRALTKKLLTLTNKSGADQLRRHFVTMPDRKAKNEQIYYIADTVSRAITLKKKISFQYYQYDARKKKQLKHDGKPYVFSPYSLVWNGDYYYMIGWCDNHGGIGSYRLERIYRPPEILAEKAIPPPKGFSASDYVGTMFRMYNSTRETVTLACDNDLMDAMIDRFGTDVKVVENRNAEFVIETQIAVNHVFYSWVFGFGGRVRIMAPEQSKTAYSEMLRAACEMITESRCDGESDGE